MVRFSSEFLPVALPLAATHGSPYPYDTHVPWIVRLPGARAGAPSVEASSGGPGRIDTYTETVDVAPTVAALLGIETPADVDGTDRSAALRDAARGADAD
jgi:arylsulfatase A-like enzyme